jgi:phenylalanyl-tRNA synthetase beta chain
MRVPLEWLHDHVRPGLSTRELATRLAMTGTEVERVHHHGVGALEHFVVARVLSSERHPDADRLTVCSVAVGEGDTATIVCGAPNVAAGQTVAVARPGAVMPDGTRLGRAKLRGVASEGMILAEDELGIGTLHAGIMVLDDLLDGGGDLVPGTPLADVLPLSTDVLELEITPNRPDCLGIYGVAREVHAATGAPLGEPPWADDPCPGDAPPPPGLEVTVASPDICPRFTVRAFEDVTIAESPPWLKARLMAAGQRPIGNVVDITNYVMLLTGHPLHAFDLDRVAGGRLHVRRAREGERLTTLDGVDRELDPDIVVIEDADGPTSLAGVMGGARSEVGEGTTRVLMEVAVWDGPNVNRTSTKLGLRSEASSRFEKGLPPEGTLEAQAVATRLMLELCGARLTGGTIDVGEPPPGAAPIRLRDARVERLLGMAVERDRSRAILDALGFGTADAPDGLDVTVPHFRRRDVTREADLVEEVARLGPLDELPATIQRNRTGRPGGLGERRRLRRRAEDVLVALGLHEIVGWSFTEPALLDRLLLPADDPLRRVVELENPLSEAQSILRPTLLGSLLDAAAHNRAREAGDLALFERGTVYRLRPRGGASDGELADEHSALGVLLTGAVPPPSWRDPEPRPADFFAAKGILEAVMGALRVHWAAEPSPRPFLHPGRSAAVVAGDDDAVGFLGELHPRVARAWDFEEPVAVFAIDLGEILPLAEGVRTYADVTAFPALRQDLAVVVGDDVPAGHVVEVVRRAGAPVLSGAGVFDVYRGEQLGEGRVSLALHLEFRAADRTLTDEDVAPVRERVVAALRDELGGELRG